MSAELMVECQLLRPRVENPLKLKPLMDMCFHFLLNLIWFTCTRYIWDPTDDYLQQYPHVFFTSPDIWDASVLDYGIYTCLS